MDRCRIRDLTLLFYCVGVLLFIWGNSAMPAAASSADSGGIRAWLLSVFPFFSEIPIFLFLVDHLRKIMHFTEFFLVKGHVFGRIVGIKIMIQTKRRKTTDKFIGTVDQFAAQINGTVHIQNKTFDLFEYFFTVVHNK